jgi:hypothetical protein
MHELSIWKIMSIYLDFYVQKIKDVFPDWIIQTDVQSINAPSWWYKFKTWEQWYYALDENRRPRTSWFTAYADCAAQWLGYYVDEVGDWARDKALTLVRIFTGFVQFGYDTFERWINVIWSRVGSFVPFFADNLADAAIRLYNMLPFEVRQGLRTFAQLFSQLADDVKHWAELRYNDVRDWYNGARLTVEQWIGQVREWWLSAKDFLDDFRHNPYGRIRQWLGSAWDWLVSFWNDPFGTITRYLGETWTRLYNFARDCLSFWYNLWGSHASEIGAFWDNPLRWVYDRVEDFLISKW